MNNDPSQNFPLNIIQGATLIQTITYYNPDGSLVNLSGYTAEMVFRTTVQDTGDPIISLSTSSGIVINGVAGTITFTIPATTTATLTDGQQMVYNLFLTSGAGVVSALLAGPAYVQGSTIQ